MCWPWGESVASRPRRELRPRIFTAFLCRPRRGAGYHGRTNAPHNHTQAASFMTTPLRFRSFLVLTILALTMPAAAQMRVVTYNCARLQGNANAFGQVIAALMVDDKPG